MLQNKDVMKSIRSSLYYYENVANSPTELERQTAIEISAAKLKDIIAHIEAELEGTPRTPWAKTHLPNPFLAIATTVDRLRNDSSNLFSTKEFQKNKVTS